MNAQNGGQSQNNKPNNLSWTTPQNTQTPKPVVPAVTSAPKIHTSPSTQSNGSSTKIVAWLAAGVVAGIVLAWVWTSLINRSPGTASDGVSQNATSTVSGGGSGLSSSDMSASSSSLTVVNPQKAGLSVAVSKVAVSQPTWVVVYEGRDGKPGNVLGAQLFTSAEQSGTVELLRGTLAGQTYFVTEQTDNGDHKFSLKDDPLFLVGDQPMWVMFVAN